MGPGSHLRGPVSIKLLAGTVVQFVDGSGNVGAVGGLTVPTAQTAVVTDADSLTVGGKIVPQTYLVEFIIPAGAAAGDYDCVKPIPRASKIVSVIERHQTAGGDSGAVTLMVKKVPSGTAKASGTDCLAAGISLKGTADTNATPALHATAGNYTFAAGDSVGLVLTGTPTSVDGVSVTIEFQRV